MASTLPKAFALPKNKNKADTPKGKGKVTVGVGTGARQSKLDPIEKTVKIPDAGAKREMVAAYEDANKWQRTESTLAIQHPLGEVFPKAHTVILPAEV